MDWKQDELKPQVEALRERINRARQILASYFVEKQEIVDYMAVCTLAQEPMLIVGKPGTAKSDLVIKWCETLGLADNEYFEYMLTKFTEPSEIVGPIDLNELKDGRYIRRVEGKMPTAEVVFLDEIFKSNSAILNTLLTLINERKYYQDGKPTPVRMKMLFAATNSVPEFDELAALRDRFPVKIESYSVKDRLFDELLTKGLANEGMKNFKRKPWAGTCSLEDFLKLKRWLDYQMAEPDDRKKFMPDEVYELFKAILRTLEKEDRVQVSDRKVIKLYRLLRARAFLLHGGAVRKEDLTLLRYIGDRDADFAPVRKKVDSILKIER